MFIANRHPLRGQSLGAADVAALGAEGARRVAAVFGRRPDNAPTPLEALRGLAAELGVGSILIKDEGQRLGLGSFKALGGGYAVTRLVLEEAEHRLGRPVAVAELGGHAVRAVAASLVFGCATDGNHGRSVAQGARDAGARAAVFVHAGVSAARIEAIARFGADIIRTPGGYDDSVAEAARTCAAKGWTVVSDTAWDGYERIPRLVMEGYTLLVDEALRAMAAPPTHVFVQAGVGGIAGAVAAHLALRLGDARPVLVVVEPARAACLLESARAGRPIRITQGEPTVMAMLECHAPSRVAWDILVSLADGFMTVDEEEAVAVMRRLARPPAGDPPIVAGESGGVGLAGLIRAMADPVLRGALRLDATSRVFLINTEGATDPALYTRLVAEPAA